MAVQPKNQEAAEANATEAAQRKAREAGVDVASVAGSGSGGKVTAADVEATAGATEQRFEVRINPALGGNVDHVVANGDAYYGGEAVTASEYEALKGAKDSEGRQLLLKRKEL